MSSSKQLRENEAQHTPKNVLSKGDDAKIAEVMDEVIGHLNSRYKLAELGWYLEYVGSIKLSELIEIIKSYDKRTRIRRAHHARRIHKAGWRPPAFKKDGG